MPAVVIAHPENEAIEIRVMFSPKMSAEWGEMSEDERAESIDMDEFEPEIVPRYIYERAAESNDEWVDNSTEWVRHPLLEEVLEDVTAVYVAAMREKYVDRLARG